MKNTLSINISVGVVFAVFTIAQAQPTAGTPPTASQSTASKISIDPHAMELLKQNQDTMLALTSYQAECRSTITYDKPRPNRPSQKYEIATLKAEKPNRMRYDSWEMPDISAQWAPPTDKPPTYTFACDGKQKFEQFGEVYRQDTRTKPEDMGTILEPWGGFYAAQGSTYGSIKYYNTSHEVREVRFDGKETVEGVVCDKIYIHVETSYAGNKMDERSTVYFGPDHLVHRSVIHIGFGDKTGNTRDAELVHIVLNSSIKPEVYVFAPPKGVTLEKPAAEVPLLANGTAAPNFTASDAAHKAVKLSDYRGKVVVLDFWASWCGPCMASMPHNQAVMSKYRASGTPVVLLAVDDGESQAAFEEWTKAKSSTFNALKFIYVEQKANISGKLYKVTGIPTQYVIDKNGLIRASFVGFDKPNDELENAVQTALKEN